MELLPPTVPATGVPAPVPAHEHTHAHAGEGFAVRLADALRATATPAAAVHDRHGHAEHAHAGHAHGPAGTTHDAHEGHAHAAAGATTLGAMLRAGTPTSGATTLGGMVAAGVAGLGSLAQPLTLPTQIAAASPAVPADAATATSGPLAGRVVVDAVDGRRTSGFGPRTHPITGKRKLHAGVDTAAVTGTPVRSVTDGVVVAAGDRGGYGLLVEVDHGGGVTTRYAHLSKIDVAVGDRLAVGQELGAVGSTGASTGPHLHMELRVDGEPIDPDDHL